MYKRTVSLVILLLFLMPFMYSNEKADYLFRTFSPEGGFYYDGINSIQQDKDGFIWILMDNDLYRFDGHQYKRYSTYLKEIDFFGGKKFNAIATDSIGKLFVGTSNGLFEYNKITDSFHKTLDSSIRYLKVDARNNLWVDVPNLFGKYNEITNNIEAARYEDKNIINVVSLDGDKSGFFILSSYKQIYRFDYESGQYNLFYSAPDNFLILNVKKSHNKLWVLVDKQGLFKMDIPTATIEEKYDFFYENETDKVPTRKLHIDKNERIWIATQKGLYVFDPKTNTHTRYLHSKTEPFSLPNNSVWYITEDRQKNIWIGTYSGGLSYVNLDEKIRFQTFTPAKSLLNTNLVSGFAEDSKSIWISTEGGGLNRMDKQSEAFTYYENKPNVSNSLSSDNVKSIVLDSKENLWIATFRGGLDCLDTKNKKIQHFRQEANNKNSLITNDLRKIVAEADSGLWIAYQLNALVVSFYSFENQNFTHYYFDKEDSNHFIFDICRGNNNTLWIITHKKLYKMNTLTGKVDEVPLENSLYLDGQTICVDGYDNIWIGTINRGLIRYNVKTSSFTVYDDILKFNVSSIYSICTDDENNLWMGTDNGLFRYETASNKFLRFDKRDGVQGQVYYPLASFKSKTGELYFGGTNGFTVVNPKDIIRNTFQPKVIISDFFIDNVPAKPQSKKYPADKMFSFPDEIILNHNQSNFGFQFSSDNYLIPEKNRFRYRLLGYDDRWIEVDATNRNVFYSKVPPGTYTFEIMTANNDGLWNYEPTTVLINRLPAPWLSWYAYILYFVLFAGILYVIIRYYIQQKRLKLQLYLDQLEKQKKEEIHQTQLRFFTNISHDFRTPLSLIMAALNNLREEGLKEYYYRILYGNSQHLLNLVNELMDFRTIENGKMPLQIEPVDVNHFVKEMAFDFADYAKQRQIDFKVTTDPLLPKSLYVDKNILEKVILNLINNAFKYTKDGGVVCVETHWTAGSFVSNHTNHYTVKGQTEPRDYFTIAVRDSGIGISKNIMPTVFERFYKAKTSNFDAQLGTGIGLALVRSLILLHKGTITIYSEKEKGTDMVVRLSYNPDIYDENDFLKEEEILQEAVLPENTQKNPNPDASDEDDILKRDKRRIMLVEDNDDLRKLIASSLSADYQVVEAPNGLVASNLLQDMEIDLIISDIMMPEKDGIAFCREVKNDVNFSHIPFILLTAKTSLESKLEGTGSGADIYFEKPIDFNLLHLSIQNIFNHQQQLKEYYAKNYFADSTELSTNQQDNKFLKKFIEILDKNLDQSEMDVNYIASELSMSRSKLYTKVKSMTDKSIVEFITSYRLRKAANLIVKENYSMREVMDKIGIESQSYFTRAFKKEFGDTPTAFAAKNKKK